MASGLALTHAEVLYLRDLVTNTTHNGDIRNSGGEILSLPVLIDKVKQYERHKRPSKALYITFEIRDKVLLVHVPRSIIRNDGMEYVIERAEDRLGGPVTFTRLPDEYPNTTTYSFSRRTVAKSKAEKQIDNMTEDEIDLMLAKLEAKKASL